MLVDTMLRVSLILTVSLLLASCSKDTSTLTLDQANVSTDTSTTTAYKFDGINAPVAVANDTEPSQQESEYPGKTIDMIFPPEPERVIEIGPDRTPTDKAMAIAGYIVHTKGNMPLRLEKDGRTYLRFRTANDWDRYHSFFVAEAKLLGKSSKQLYIVALGPGAVCCTNYWIVDIAGRSSRIIFRSEEYGAFRDPMEIFDADGDGIYELVQYDSVFRYFAGDCGSCSPEPKAYFKYDAKKRRYLPAKGIAEDFALAGMRKTQKWLAEKRVELRASNDPGLAIDISRTALSLTADLLYLGQTKKAWNVFDTYVTDPKGELRKEMQWDLRQSKFYQALRRLPAQGDRKRR